MFRAFISKLLIWWRNHAQHATSRFAASRAAGSAASQLPIISKQRRNMALLLMFLYLSIFQAVQAAAGLIELESPHPSELAVGSLKNVTCNSKSICRAGLYAQGIQQVVNNEFLQISSRGSLWCSHCGSDLTANWALAAMWNSTQASANSSGNQTISNMATHRSNNQTVHLMPAHQLPTTNTLPSGTHLPDGLNVLIDVTLKWTALTQEPIIHHTIRNWNGRGWDTNPFHGCTAQVLSCADLQAIDGIPRGVNERNTSLPPDEACRTGGRSFVITSFCRLEGMLKPYGDTQFYQRKRFQAQQESAHLIGSGTPVRLASWALPNSTNKLLVNPNAAHYHVVKVMALSSSSCALYVNGSIACWGFAEYGRLGFDAKEDFGDDEGVNQVPLVRLPHDFIAVRVVGSFHVCALSSLGNVACWGRNDYGQLGQGVAPHTHLPQRIDLAGAAVDVASGDFHNCAIVSGGNVVCWGANSFGQSGASITTLPVEPTRVLLSTEASSIACGNAHSCVSDAFGSVICWGLGSSGQLGYGTTNSISLGESGFGSAISFGNRIFHAVQVIALEVSSCAMSSDGEVMCWGNNDFGQLGQQSASRQLQPVPVELQAPAVQISGTYRHCCALLSIGQLQCWGLNGDGQLGLGHVETVGRSLDLSPAVAGGSKLPSRPMTLSVGSFHTCWVELVGSAHCMGRGSLGRLGYGNTEDVGDDELTISSMQIDLRRSEQATEQDGLACPILQIEPFSWVVEMILGTDHSCMLYANGRMQCWGSARDGRLGTGQSGVVGISVPPLGAKFVPTNERIVQGSAYGGTCVLTTTGKVFCYGDGSYGQNGLGTTDSTGQDTTLQDLLPVDVSSPFIAVSHVSRGSAHTCATLVDGSLRCWGEGSAGKTGQGNEVDIGGSSSRPVADGVIIRLGNHHANKVDCFRSHTCASTAEGAMYCFGFGGYGRLGYGSYSHVGDNEAADSRGAISFGQGSEHVIDFGLGFQFSCALLQSGQVTCWGRNEHFQLGILDDASSKATPQNVAQGNESAIALAVSHDHACAVWADGGVSCWGSNELGRLGYGDTINRGGPLSTSIIERVPIHKAAVKIFSRGRSTCVLYFKGEFACWGSGFNGRLGTGNQLNIGDDLVPTDVPSQRTSYLHLAAALPQASALSLAQAACPKLKANLWTEPSLITIPLSADVTVWTSVPAWFHNIVTSAHAFDSPPLSGAVFFLCERYGGRAVVSGLAAPGGQQETSRGFCVWPDEWERKNVGVITAISPLSSSGQVQAQLTGGTSVSIAGDFWIFALVPGYEPPKIMIGTSFCDSLRIVSIRTMSCSVPPLSGWPLAKRVPVSLWHSLPSSFALNPIRSDVTLAYAAPLAIRADPSIGVDFFGAKIQILGQNFGPNLDKSSHDKSANNKHVSVAVFDTPLDGSVVAYCNVTVFWATEIHCNLPPGNGTVYLQVQVAGQNAESRVHVSFASPQISRVEPSSILMGTATHESLRVFGNNFGSILSSVSIALGPHVICNSSVRISSKELLCRNVSRSALFELRGIKHDVRIFIDRRQAVLPAALRVYGPISLFPVTPQTIPRDGGELNLAGSEFGRPVVLGTLNNEKAGDIIEVRLGQRQTVCTDIEVIGNSLTCRVPAGHGELNSVSIHRRGGSNYSRSAQIQYAKAIVSAVEPNTVLVAAPSNPEKKLVTIRGRFFDTSTFMATDQHPDILVSFGGAPCVGGVRFLNSSLLQCLVPVRQLGAQQQLHLQVYGIRAHVLPEAEIRVLGQPSLASISPASVAALGGQRVKLFGQNLGLAEEPAPRISVGKAACQDVLVESSSSLQCTVPSAEAALSTADGPSIARVVITTHGGLSASLDAALTYTQPDIISVEGGYFLSHIESSTGRHTITLYGANLAEYDNRGNARQSHFFISNATCESISGTVIMESGGRSISCSNFRISQLPAAAPGEVRNFVATVQTFSGQQAHSGFGSIIAYGPPTITSISPSRISSGQDISLSGHNLGLRGEDVVSATVNGIPLQVVWLGEKSLSLGRMPVLPLTAVHPQFSLALRSGHGATFDGGNALTYILPLASPTLAPRHLCAYRDVNQAARVVFLWEDDATTASHGITEWLIETSLDPPETQSGAGVARRVAGDQGETVAGHLDSVPANCRDLIRKSIKPNVQRIMDVRVSDAPSQPFWLNIRGVIADASARFVGPVSETAGPVFQHCKSTEYLATQYIKTKEWPKVVCMSCPDGALCDGLPFEGMTNKRGYSRSPFNPSGVKFLRCETEDVCVTAPLPKLHVDEFSHLLSSESNAQLLPSPIFNLLQITANGSTLSAANAANCIEGHSGPMCAVCRPGYMDQGDGRCAECADRSTIIAALAGGTVLALCIVAYLIYSTIAASSRPAQTYVALNKLLVSHMQQISLAAVFPLRWPAFLMSMFQFFDAGSSVSTSIISVECLQLDSVSGYRGAAVMTLLAPPFILTACAIFWFVLRPAVMHLAQSKRCQSATEDVPENVEENDTIPSEPNTQNYSLAAWEGMLVSAIIEAFLLHLSVTEFSLGLFTCRDVDGSSRLAADLSIDCDDPAHQQWMYGIGVTAFVVYGLGIPATAFLALYLHRSILFTARGKALYGFLVSSLEPEYYFWEPIVQSRKVGFTFVATLMAPLGLGLRLAASLVLLATFMVAHLLAMPYDAILLDYFEAASAFIVLVTLSCGSALVDTSVSNTSKMVVSILIMIINIALIGAIVYTLILEAWKDPQIQHALRALRRIQVQPMRLADAQPKNESRLDSNAQPKNGPRLDSDSKTSAPKVPSQPSIIVEADDGQNGSSEEQNCDPAMTASPTTRTMLSGENSSQTPLGVPSVKDGQAAFRLPPIQRH